MRGGRRDLRVAACGVERARREGRHIVGMDDVVREAGVIRRLREHPLEQGAGLKLLGVGLVGRRRGLKHASAQKICASLSSG